MFGYGRQMKKDFGWGFRNLFFYYHNEYEISFRGQKDLNELKKILKKKFNQKFVSKFGQEIIIRSNLLKNITKKAFASKINLKKYLQEFYQASYNLFAYFQLPEYSQFFVSDSDKKLLIKFGLARDFAARQMIRNEKIYREQLGRLLNLPKSTALMLIPPEVDLYLRTGKFPKNLFSRKSCVVKMVNGKIEVLWNKKADEFFKKNNPINVLKKNISGQTAYPGKVSGRVYVALSMDQFKKIPQGAILVCSITRYDVVPYLNRVKAIITDQGGITCHTAIIAREMKIPAVIGTQYATDILKTGDWVEVDAERGIVEKLKK